MKIRNQFILRLGGWFAYLFMQVWMSTLQFRAFISNKSVDPAVPDPDPDQPRRRIYLLWHEYMLPPIYLRPWCNIAILLSQHDDATVLYYATRIMGFDPVRGSTKHGATKAVRELMGKTKEAKHLAITPDGPRGPRRTVAPGAIFLASQLQMPIVLMTFGYNRPWRFGSWDRFALPRPFSRCRVILSDEITIPPDLNKTQIEEYRLQIEQQFNELTEQTEQWAESGNTMPGEFRCSKRTFGQVTYNEQSNK